MLLGQKHDLSQNSALGLKLQRLASYLKKKGIGRFFLCFCFLELREFHIHSVSGKASLCFHVRQAQASAGREPGSDGREGRSSPVRWRYVASILKMLVVKGFMNTQEPTRTPVLERPGESADFNRCVCGNVLGRQVGISCLVTDFKFMVLSSYQYFIASLTFIPHQYKNFATF